MPGSFRRSSARFVPVLECLEGRVVPAGIINSSYSSATKTLTLIAVNDLDVGDAALNHQEINITGIGGLTGAFVVTGVGGEDILGVADGDATVSNVKNIKLVMGLGDDIVTVRNANLTGLLTFLGGDGQNILDIDGNGGGNTLGRVSITNGEGTDGFIMHDGTNQITGKLTINNGQGDSETAFGDLATDQTSVGGPVSITNGAGAIDGFFCTGQQVGFAKAVTIRNGSGPTQFELDGTITSTFTFGGTLTVINGDGFDEYAFGTSGVGTLSLHSVSIRNGIGGSQFAFDGLSNTVTGDLLISNGDGNDTLTCNLATSVTVTGAVTIQNGTGDSTITWNANSTTIGGLTTLSSAAGDDAITFAGVIADLHSVKILTGNGESDINLNSTSALTMTGNLTVIGGQDNDILTTPATSALNVTGSATFILGNSSNIQGVFLGSGTTIGGKLTIRGGDQPEEVSLDGIAVNGAVLIDLGRGDDAMEIENSTLAAAVTIIMGGGDDLIELERSDNTTGTTFNGPVTVLGGSGDDLLRVGRDANDFAIFNAAPVKFDGGSGLDTLELVANVFPPGNPIQLSWETII